jgi:uncharacterized protein
MADNAPGMRVWIDLSNSPHVALFEPIVERLRQEDEDVILTVRHHAQTLDLAARVFPKFEVVGGQSPPSRSGKGRAIVSRAGSLARFARRHRPDVALSHGSYAQILGARAAGVPSVTMMDYEFQPANHLSFRLARRVVVPTYFPPAALRRFGAPERKVLRYDGFKEDLYLDGFTPDPAVLRGLGIDASRVIAVMRPAPEGALYHRGGNERFEQVFEKAASRPDVRVVVLPRTEEQRTRYTRPGVILPERAIDGRSLLAYADVMIGAGGTMNRESALLGTPTYTLFAERMAAVDVELMRRGFMHDLRVAGAVPEFTKKRGLDCSSAGRGDAILETVLDALRTASSRRFRSRAGV